MSVDVLAELGPVLSDDEALERQIETARLAATNEKDAELARAGFKGDG